MRRSLDPLTAKSAGGSRSGSGKDDVSIRIGDGPVAEGVLQRLQRGHSADGRICDLLESIEIVPAARGGRDLAGALGKASQNVGRVCSAEQIDRAWNLRPGQLRIGGRDRDGGSRTPAKDTAQLPPLNDPRYKTGRVAQEFPARSEWQLERSVAPEIVGAMERQKAVVETVVSGVQIFDAAVCAAFAQSPAPRISKVICKTMRQTFRHLQRHRMVCGTAWIRTHDHGRILRIGDDEVVGKSVSCQQTSGFAGDRC